VIFARAKREDDMARKPFAKTMAGAQDALAYAKGDKSRGVVKLSMRAKQPAGKMAKRKGKRGA
jgi:hypothetical protein